MSKAEFIKRYKEADPGATRDDIDEAWKEELEEKRQQRELEEKRQQRELEEKRQQRELEERRQQRELRQQRVQEVLQDKNLTDGRRSEALVALGAHSGRLA